MFTLGGASALVDPGFYQRIFAATSYRAVAVALSVGIVLWAAFDWVVTILGMVAQASELPIAEPRYALLEATVAVLPAGLLGLFLVGVVATAFWTELAIGVLVFGAPAVFVWFLTDAVPLLRGLGEDRPSEGKAVPEGEGTGTSGAESGF